MLALALCLAPLPSPVFGQDADSTPGAAATPAGPREVIETPEATQVDPRFEAQARCRTIATALGSKKVDAKLLADPETKALAASQSQLVTCGAVLRDSDETCTRFFPVEQGPSTACRQMRALFHELRTYPGKPSYLFTEYDWQQCRQNPGLTEMCDKLRAALRSGDEKQCAGLGAGEPLCRAGIADDVTKCDTATSVPADATITRPDAKEGEPATINLAQLAAHDCREKMTSRAVLAGGLEKLAESGPARERILARAALGQEEACQELVGEACTSAPPQPGTPGAGAPGGTPGAAAPGAAPATTPGAQPAS